MSDLTEQHFLFRSEEQPFQKYVAPTQSFLVCVFCCKVVMPGDIIFDVSDEDVAHDDCGIDKAH